MIIIQLISIICYIIFVIIGILTLIIGVIGGLQDILKNGITFINLFTAFLLSTIGIIIIRNAIVLWKKIISDISSALSNKFHSLLKKYKKKKNLSYDKEEVSYQEIDDLNEYVSNYLEENYDNQNTNIRDSFPKHEPILNKDDLDDYKLCCEYVLQNQKASSSLLQREFMIGYNKACRFIDQLEADEIIGPQYDSKPREVYRTFVPNDYYENIELKPVDPLSKTNTVSSNYIFTIHTPMKNIDYIYEWLRDNPNTLEEVSKQLKDLITINDYQINYAIDTLLKNNAIFYHNHVLEVTDNFYFRFEYEPNEEYEILSSIYNTSNYQEFKSIKTGIEFEYFLADLLKKNGYETELTPKSNDYGADIIATRDNIKYAIQCKFYSKPIGINAVQEVLGALQYYKCNVAIVATNNTYTNNALELAQKSNVILWDGNYILKTFI